MRVRFNAVVETGVPGFIPRARPTVGRRLMSPARAVRGVATPSVMMHKVDSQFTEPLPPDFYNRDPVTVARELLGKVLVRRTPQGLALAGLSKPRLTWARTTPPLTHTGGGRSATRRCSACPAGPTFTAFTRSSV